MISLSKVLRLFLYMLLFMIKEICVFFVRLNNAEKPFFFLLRYVREFFVIFFFSFVRKSKLTFTIASKQYTHMSLSFSVPLHFSLHDSFTFFPFFYSQQCCWTSFNIEAHTGACT